jgi:class 3 adenylate cyclase
MELLADRDPEEARRLLDPVLERMMEAVHRYEGTVNQVMGDGIMALFGAPLAHEDHAVRACYAALRMQESLKRYADDTRRVHGVEVQIRVGLNSGEVVVRTVGSDLRMDYTAVGKTTHLAARMEQLAPPGAIYVTASVLRLVQGQITARAVGPTPVKGLSSPVDIWEILGPGPASARFEAGAELNPCAQDRLKSREFDADGICAERKAAELILAVVFRDGGPLTQLQRRAADSDRGTRHTRAGFVSDSAADGSASDRLGIRAYRAQRDHGRNRR